MFARSDFQAKVSVYKDFVAEPNYVNWMTVTAATSGFDVTEGFGSDTADTKIAVGFVGGFHDQKATASVKFTSPSVSGTESVNLFVRGSNLSTNTRRRYAALRLHQGFARLTVFVGDGVSDVATLIAQEPWAFEQGVLATLTLQAIGSIYIATMTSATGSPAPLTLAGADGQLESGGGVMGLRTFSSTMRCRDILMEAA
jgi:hypothetical protein